MIIFKNRNITVFQSMMFQMNSTVVVTRDLVLVVDPGYLPQEVEEIRLYVNHIRGNLPVYLFFTHSDFDHIVGAGAFPEAKTIASREFAESPFKDKHLRDIQQFDDELYINRTYTINYPQIDYRIEGNGEQLIVGGTVITFYHAFGHTNDGLFALINSVNLLISGDYLSDIEFPFIYHSYVEYEKTLNAFNRLLINRERLLLIPGHGNATEEIAEIQKRINDAEDYFKQVKINAGENEFKRFLIEKNYGYLSNLNKRHQENLVIWRKQGK